MGKWAVHVIRTRTVVKKIESDFYGLPAPGIWFTRGGCAHPGEGPGHGVYSSFVHAKIHDDIFVSKVTVVNHHQCLLAEIF